MNKLTSLESLILSIEPDFLALTETWLTKDIKDFEMALPNYAILRKDRPSRGGGVAILIKRDIPFVALPEVTGVEAVFCKLRYGLRPICVGCVYRSPSSDCDTLQSLYAYMHQHVLGAKLILLGDFNLADINWQTMQHHSTCSDILIDTMLTFNLSQIVTRPTRVQKSCSSILDLVFLSEHFPSDKAKVDLLDGISDHDIILCTVPTSDTHTPPKSFVTYPDCNNADDSSVIDHLSFELASFERLGNDINIDIETLWGKFKAVVSHCIDNYVPTKTKQTRKQNPWITRDIIHAKRKVKRLRKQMKAKRDPELKTTLSLALTSMKAKIKSAKSMYFTHTLPTFLKTSPQKFWNYLNPKKCDSNIATPDENKTRANLFNDYFKSVFTEDNGICPDISVPFNRQLDPLIVSETGVLNLLLNIDTKKGAGPDNIPNVFLKRYAEWMAKYLCIIFNKSLATSSLPAEWKMAKVIPVHKSGSESDASNFRPISLTSTICKLLEHIILKHITTFLDRERVLSPFQHGFRQGVSTVTQLLELIHELSLSVDHQKQTDLIMLDFSKAFDRVPHLKLLKKVESTIGKGPISDWIRDYLSDRSQYVQIQQERSPIVKVTSGVPQGSVLAPILFLIFINDLPKNIRVNIRLFADDCIIYQEINSPQDHLLLNSALQSVSDWCSDWQMTLNTTKSALLRITRKQQISNFCYNVNNVPLTVVNEQKYLGVTLTHDLRWDSHVANVTSAALRRLFFLRRRLRQAPPETKILAYNTFVKPALEYANVTWFPYTNTLIQKLEIVQRKAIRFIYNKYRTTDSPTELLKKAEILTLKQRAKVARQKILYKLVNEQINIDISKYISKAETRPTRHTHSLTLREYQCRTDCFKFSFFPLAIHEWNNLPPSVTSSPTYEAFSSLLENHLRTFV